MMEKEFIELFDKISMLVQIITEDHGWTCENDGEKIALMHSELSEALEYLRCGNPESNHIPGFSGIEEEFADTIIRIMHFGARKKLNIAGALFAKIKFNNDRPFRHGGKKF